MKTYNSVDCDKLLVTHDIINDVKSTLLDNLEKLNERGEKLESLIEKS